MTSNSFDALENEILHDPQVRENLTRFATTWKKTRGNALAEVDFEALRQALKGAKTRALEALPGSLDEFIARARRAGANVHMATDAAEACAIVIALARERNVAHVVKSKSMVSEEIHLNQALERAGMRVVETDLGEWIIQLAQEKPSHMVVPAIHKNRRQIGELFTRTLQREVSREQISEQVRTARLELRAEFLRADMGVSGANALVVESGTIMIVTNEGNGRLVTTVPRVHVAIAGFDKLLPTFDDAVTLLRLLSRSATGRSFTSYVTWITGAARAGQEMHLVLVDNGRTRMNHDPDFHAALRCVRCAACANICPAYQVVGGHLFGHVYTGPIGLVLTPFHHGLDAIAGPQSLCMSCNACEKVCPVDIPLPRLILKVREQVVHAQRLPLVKRLAFAVWQKPALADGLLRAAALMARPFVDDDNHLRRPMAGRVLPAPAPRPFRDVWLRRVSAAQEFDSRIGGQTVAFFPGCLTDRLFPDMADAVVRVLEACGARVLLPHEQHCCGLPALNSGDASTAKAMARQTLGALAATTADYIVSGSTSCVVSITQDYADLLRDVPEQLSLQRSLRERTFDLATFLSRVAQPRRRSPLAGAASGPVTVHDACQSFNCLGLRREVRDLLTNLAGAEIREMQDASVCCGFGGSFSAEHPGVAGHVVDRKLAMAEDSGATVIVADNPGCLMHLRARVKARGKPIRVRHFAEVIADALVHEPAAPPAPSH